MNRIHLKREKRQSEKWKSVAVLDIEETQELLATANYFVKREIKSKDALHVASAIAGKASYFLTTDDKLIKKLSDIDEIQIINPVDMIGIIDGYND